VDGCVSFHDADDAPLALFDHAIERTCTLVNRIVDDVESKHADMACYAV
jgi:hypothetical protein